MFKDYYAILEIAPSASIAEIKAAYKRQAVKWHPDKNNGRDTTRIMQDINEAYLFLGDDEARDRYNKEYVRFKKFEEEREKNKAKSNYSDARSRDEARQGQSKKESEENTASYSTSDDILKKWMDNARKQAVRNVYEMVKEFRTASSIGFQTFFGIAVKAVIIAMIFSLIAYFILKFNL